MSNINTKNIEAFLIGCSEYNDSNQNLLYVNNDIKILKDSLINSIKIPVNNISTYSGMIKIEDYKNIINRIKLNKIEDKMLFFYFSGHGFRKKKTESNIVFSDGKVSINELLKDVNESNYKYKWIIIDACYPGQFIINEDNLLIGEGCIVTCSSSKDQKSYANNNETMSYFTEILCNVLNYKSLKHKSLTEIINLIRIIYKNDNSKQTLISRQNFLGTIYLGEDEYIFKKDDREVKYEYKDEKFYTVSYEVLHSLTVKKYCIHVISKVTNEKDLHCITNKIIEIFNQIEHYNNDKQKIILKDKPVDFLSIHIYPDEYNYNIKNSKCIIEYSISKGINIIEQKSFDSILENRINNTIDDDILLNKINNLYNESLDILKDLYKIIQEIKNNNWTEESSNGIYITSRNKLNKIYNKYINLPFGSNVEYIYELVLEYFNDIQDLLLFMSKKGQNTWNNKDTRYYMINDTINKINRLLNYFKMKM